MNQETPNPEVNYFEMPDEQITNMMAPSAPVAVDPAEPVDPVDPVEPQLDPAPQDPVEPVVNTDPAPVDPVVDPAAPKADAPAGDTDPKPAVATDPTPKAEDTPDYAAFYNELLGQPIKANGKEIQLRSLEEIKQLLQMGLNYTKKTQAMQPVLRVVKMLENNGLLDEAKLAHLIDVDKGNPQAIQRLLADKKFDPNQIDSDEAASYVPGNHQVSDTEMAFNAALDELETSPTGVEIIQAVAKQWDEQSRRAALQDPSILQVLHQQKTLGLYDVITTEMDRLTTLGQLQGVPFLQAYRAVGDMLNDAGKLKPKADTTPPIVEAPVETRVAAPAPTVDNSAQALAATPTRATPASKPIETNLLDLPDDEFLKRFNGRV